MSRGGFNQQLCNPTRKRGISDGLTKYALNPSLTRRVMFSCIRTHSNILSLLCLFVVTIAGCHRKASETSPTELPSTTPPVAVQIAKAELTTLQPTLDLIGTIVAIPERTAVISPQFGGWVSKLDVVESQSVQADETLVELDPRSAKVMIQKAEAVVAEKNAAVARLKSGYLPEEIAGVKQDADNAAATVDALKNELKALKDLLDRNEISPVLYENKSKALASAEAAFASAQEKVKLLEAGTRPELIAEAKGVLGAAEADLEQAKLTLDWCTITSPVEGIVTQLLARRGQFFDRAVPLATVIDLTEVFAQIRIPSVQFAKVHIGSAVEIELASFPGEVFGGEVTRISGQADPATGNVVVFAKIDNSDLKLRPGLSCLASVSLPEITDALVVPVAAVADNAGTPVVTVIRDAKAYETEVTLGVETKTLVQILSGLSPSDTVTTAGGYGLPEGCPVTITTP